MKKQTELQKQKPLSGTDPSMNGKPAAKRIKFPIIVVGASAGGLKAIQGLMENFPFETNAAVFIVLHLSALSNGEYMLDQIQQSTKLKCKLASHRADIKPGTVYFAVPGQHLILDKYRMSLGQGPEENRFKPSIDILFRTAAVNHREWVTGILLSGLLDDGVSGMLAVKRCGGMCVIQDPTEAEYAAMPLAVMAKMSPDYILPVTRIGNVIKEWAANPKKKMSIPKELLNEIKIAEDVLSGIDETARLGTHSLFTCPDCGGGLWTVDDPDLRRYRCFTGHAYNETTLLQKQGESIQTTLYIALRLFEERKKLIEKIPGRTNNAHRVAEIETHVTRLKELLTDLHHLKAGDISDISH